MKLRIHYLQHVSFEGLGSLEQLLLKAGHQVSRTRLYLNEPLPSLDDFDLLIVMGGPMGVNDVEQIPWLALERELIRNAIECKKRVLGICLGAQLIAAALSARVFKNVHREIGWFDIYRSRDASSQLLGKGIPERMEAFHWHGDTFDLPQGAIRLASSDACENQAFAFEDHVLALQFHLESTFDGAKLLVNECEADLIPGPYVQTESEILANPERFDRINAQMPLILQPLLSNFTSIGNEKFVSPKGR